MSDIILIPKTLTLMECWCCKGTGGFNMADDGEDEDMQPCPECHPPKITSEGLTYVAMGLCGGVLLETDCGILSHEANECGPTIDAIGLDEPPDIGIWKAVVEYWGHVDYDSGYTVVDGWEVVESYPEPPCAKLGKDTCRGMLAPRNDDETVWACDKHAGQVS